MIIRHQTNVAGFVGAHTTYWLPNQLMVGLVAVTSGAGPASAAISQARTIGRFTSARVFGRVN